MEFLDTEMVKKKKNADDGVIVVKYVLMVAFARKK
jgi:hypothetical protein